ncbi:MAG: hypothetical protein M1820_001975 [Bogoriella megaspora]|nr:MAG: hypothetical protein M1820_001975 [Bogoriella megaspora]
MEGFPMRAWNITIYLEDDKGNNVEANIFEKAKYELHPTFESRAIQTFKKPPFKCSETGWGEFDMKITLTVMHKGGDHTLNHDLNFQSERYEARHQIIIRNPKPELIERLKETGPVNEVEARGKGADASKKRSRKAGNVDMEKLAEGLQRLTEDDLLQVVQMVHDNKTAETYTKNDVENGEFHVDLYTLPDTLVKMLWDFTTSKTDI